MASNNDPAWNANNNWTTNHEIYRTDPSQHASPPPLHAAHGTPGPGIPLQFVVADYPGLVVRDYVPAAYAKNGVVRPEEPAQGPWLMTLGGCRVYWSGVVYRPHVLKSQGVHAVTARVLVAFRPPDARWDPKIFGMNIDIVDDDPSDKQQTTGESSLRITDCRTVGPWSTKFVRTVYGERDLQINIQTYPPGGWQQGDKGIYFLLIDLEKQYPIGTTPAPTSFPFHFEGRKKAVMSDGWRWLVPRGVTRSRTIAEERLPEEVAVAESILAGAVRA